MLPGTRSTYRFTPFRIIPNAPITCGVTVVFVFHILLTSISRSLYFEIFSTSFAAIFQSDGTAISINMHIFVGFSLITMSGLFALISLSVIIGISHSIVASFPSTTFSGS